MMLSWDLALVLPTLHAAHSAPSRPRSSGACATGAAGAAADLLLARPELGHRCFCCCASCKLTQPRDETVVHLDHALHTRASLAACMQLRRLSLLQRSIRSKHGNGPNDARPGQHAGMAAANRRCLLHNVCGPSVLQRRKHAEQPRTREQHHDQHGRQRRHAANQAGV